MHLCTVKCFATNDGRLEHDVLNQIGLFVQAMRKGFLHVLLTCMITVSIVRKRGCEDDFFGNSGRRKEQS